MGFDAVLVVSFGGPEGVDDVAPFLENVLRGRPVPPQRMQQVAAHYLELGGVSPINGQNRALVEALGRALDERPQKLPGVLGQPQLASLSRRRGPGAWRQTGSGRRPPSSPRPTRPTAAAGSTSRTWPGLGAEAGPGAPELVKLRPYFNHPGFVEPLADGLRAARAEAGPDAPVLMSAHSIPSAMAATCDYESHWPKPLDWSPSAAGVPPEQWSLVYQSRSGPPQQPWLGPDINDAHPGPRPPPLRT